VHADVAEELVAGFRYRCVEVELGVATVVGHELFIVGGLVGALEGGQLVDYGYENDGVEVDVAKAEYGGYNLLGSEDNGYFKGMAGFNADGRIHD